MKIQYFIGDIVSVASVQETAVVCDVIIRRNGTTYRWNSQRAKNIFKDDIVEYHLYYLTNCSRIVEHRAEELKLVEGGPLRKMMTESSENDDKPIPVAYVPVDAVWHYSSAPVPRIPNRCPICNGTGLVSRPPGIAGDVEEWTSTGTGPYTCNACGGTGIIWS